ncbi:hypothetical protein QBC34DRAFT_399156 [Podospora aff. communis PSN243]|uniref:Uncharacterized protein n=1 Tax=Podospora aff. communis PSN243 TaxID=3040156 RepID=A0AAV9GTT3_9PEZI|nr:hypothetical protein QBC34DRAFT_399156 [Podospora aff. communis PSN243]
MADPNEVLGPILSAQSMQLDLPPSCVEFCPAFPSYFLVGTYNLQKDESSATAKIQGHDDEPRAAGTVKPQTRNGSVITFRLTDKTIIHIQTESLPSAILDLHFNPNYGYQDCCGAVSSTATLAMFRFCPDQDQPLRHIRTMDMAIMAGSAGDAESEPKDLLFLSFCWHPSRSDTIAVTTSTGNVHLVSLGSIEGGSWVLNPEPVITHTLEAWCVAVSPTLKVPGQDGGDSFTVFSGGDDSALRYRSFARATDLRTTDFISTPGDITVAIKRQHDAGVTAILPLAMQETGSEFVLTGSYDDHIRLFAVGPAIYGPSVTRMLAERNLGGGVWRLKLVTVKNKPGNGTWAATILASCMHGGARIVELVKTEAGDYQFHVVGSFVEHKSMNYGSDFQPGETGGLTVVSTSFYDKLLCLWEFPLR